MVDNASRGIHPMGGSGNGAGAAAELHAKANVMRTSPNSV